MDWDRLDYCVVQCYLDLLFLSSCVSVAVDPLDPGLSLSRFSLHSSRGFRAFGPSGRVAALGAMCSNQHVLAITFTIDLQARVYCGRQVITISLDRRY